MKLAAEFIPAADEVYRLQGGSDPECILFQKFAELGHYGGRPGTTRQGTYATTPSGMFLGSINSNDPVRVAQMLQRALAKWQTVSREDRMSSSDPQKQLADIKRPERFYPKDGLVLYVTSRDMPRQKAAVQPPGKDFRKIGGLGGAAEQAWNQDYAWFTKGEVRQFLPQQVRPGQKQDVPLAVINRIACAHLVDNVRGQTTPFEESQVKKARLTAEVMAVDGTVVSLRLEGETLTADEGTRKHGLDMKLLGKATYDLLKGRFLTFEMVALGSRWGGTQNNSRRGDLDMEPIGLLFTLAGDSPCERVAPAYNFHKVYLPVVSGD
jgi:hypothetical protein